MLCLKQTQGRCTPRRRADLHGCLVTLKCHPAGPLAQASIEQSAASCLPVSAHSRSPTLLTMREPMQQSTDSVCDRQLSETQDGRSSSIKRHTGLHDARTILSPRQSSNLLMKDRPLVDGVHWSESHAPKPMCSNQLDVIGQRSTRTDGMARCSRYRIGSLREIRFLQDGHTTCGLFASTLIVSADWTCRGRWPLLPGCCAASLRANWFCF